MIRETGVKQKLAIGKSEEDEKNFLIICMMKNGTAVSFSILYNLFYKTC